MYWLAKPADKGILLMKHHLCNIALIVSIALIFIPFSAAQGNQEREQLVNSMRQLYQSEHWIEQALDIWQIPSAVRPVFRDHIQHTFSDQAVLDRLVDNMMPFRSLRDIYDETTMTQLGFDVGLTTMNQLVSLGMRRLSTEDLRYIFNHTLEMSYGLDVETCAAIFREQVSDEFMVRVELDYTSRLPEPQLRRYLSVVRRAAMAEANGRPSVQLLTSTQQSVAEHMFDAKITNHQHAEDIYQALWEPNSVSDEHYCLAMEEVLALILQDSTDASGWIIRMLVLDQQS